MLEQEARRTLGQIFALRLPRSPEALDLERFPLANYIVFSDALEPALDASRDRLQRARALILGAGIDPLFMMDEEGGRVSQVSRFFATAPSPRAVAGGLAPDQAGGLYAQLGAFLRDVGIDVDLAPCLDVLTESLNPIIGTRSYGGDPAAVSRFGRAAVHGLGRSIACVGKHFPGHGMTRLDSHLARPVADDSRETIRRVHLAPFGSAIDAGVDGMMISHCAYPGLDPERLPATLSGPIVRGLLRDGLGFDGLVITDSMDMRAVTGDFTPGEAALKAFSASCDILLYTEFGERFEAAFETLLEGLLRGAIDPAAIDSSLRRRERVLCRLRRPADPGATYDRRAYLALAEAARAGAVRSMGPVEDLPLEPGALVAGTAGRALRRIADRGITVVDLGRRDAEVLDWKGRAVLLWLAEPLTLGHSIQALRSAASAADRSVLVTTYQAVAEALPDCAVRMISDDLSPATEDRLLERVIGIPPAD